MCMYMYLVTVSSIVFGYTCWQDSSDIFELPAVTTPRTPGMDLRQEKPQCKCMCAGSTAIRTACMLMLHTVHCNGEIKTFLFYSLHTYLYHIAQNFGGRKFGKLF